MNRLLTLVLALSLIFTVVVDVDAHIDTPRARSVAPHRMIKKRADALGGLLGPATPQNVGADPAGVPAAGGANAAGSSSAAVASTAAEASRTAAATSEAPTATPVASKAQTTAAAAASATNTDGGLLGGILGPIVGGSTATKANATAAAPTNTTSSVASTTSSTQSTTSLTPTSSSSSTTALSTNTNTVTYTQPVAAETSSAALDTNGGAHITRNTIIILAAIGASIAAAGIIWTIIRKWKFRPSSSFEDRMQPIDWQPTTHDDDHGRDITEKVNRSASVRSHGSFTSGRGGAHGGGDMNGNGNGNNNGGGLIADLPPLDYPAQLAPIGGYADLHRGGTPQPVYQYDMPNPHQMQMQQQPLPAPGHGYGQAPPVQYYGGYEQHPQQGGYEQHPHQGGYEQRGY